MNKKSTTLLDGPVKWTSVFFVHFVINMFLNNKIMLFNKKIKFKKNSQSS